jgi:hypothetical protein
MACVNRLNATLDPSAKLHALFAGRQFIVAALPACGPSEDGSDGFSKGRIAFRASLAS